MMKLFYGTDTIKVRQVAMAEADAQREGGVSVERLETKDITAARLIDIASSVSLFGGETAYVFDTPSEDKEAEEILLKHLSALAESGHTILIIETAVLAAVKKLYEKTGAELIEYKKEAGKQTFDPFQLAGALLTKDKKSMWMLLTESVRLGISQEEMVGIIWWQLKTLRLANVGKSADEVGLKSYPYDKAKRALRNFAPGELERLSQSLLLAHHEARSGRTELGVGLERWVLGV